MAGHILILSKVIGTVSLGILAGATASNSLVSLPSILINSKGVDSQSQDSVLVRLYEATVAEIVIPLSTVAFSSLVGAYIFAPPNGRHPYLIYSALSIPIIAGLNYLYGPGISYTNLLSGICQCATTIDADNISLAPPTSNPIPQSVPKPSPVIETDEPSLLDNSVYAHLETPGGSSDIELSSASSNTPTPDEQSEDELSTVHQSISTTHSVSDIEENLHKLGIYSSVVIHLAFLISTIGIYGDLS